MASREFFGTGQSSVETSFSDASPRAADRCRYRLVAPARCLRLVCDWVDDDEREWHERAGCIPGCLLELLLATPLTAVIAGGIAYAFDWTPDWWQGVLIFLGACVVVDVAMDAVFDGFAALRRRVDRRGR